MMTRKKAFSEEVYITPNLPLSTHLRNLILRRIWLGEYPVGQLLPSVRTLAEELGVNRNTVSKVYQELAAEGYVITLPGKGSLISDRPIGSGLLSSRDAIQERVDEIIQYAQETGIERQELVKLLDNSLNKHYDRQGIRLAFVECSERDTIDLSKEITLATAVPVAPLHLGDLLNRPADFANFDLVITTFFHINEVEETLRSVEARTEVIAIQINPVPDILLEIARLKSGTKVGIVSSNERTSRGLQNILRMYNAAVEVRTLVLEGNSEGLEELAAWADVLLDSQSVEARVAQKARGTRILTVRFQIDTQSIQFVRARLVELVNEHVVDPGVLNNLSTRQMLWGETYPGKAKEVL